jgi:hypothetical protein
MISSNVMAVDDAALRNLAAANHTCRFCRAIACIKAASSAAPILLANSLEIYPSRLKHIIIEQFFNT